MLRPFLNWFDALPIDDPVQRAQAGLLQGLVLAVLIGRLLLSALELSAPALVPASLQGARALVVVAVLAGIVAALRRGWLRPAVLAMIAVTMVTVTRALSGVSFAESSVVAIGYIIAIALAGLVLSRLSLVVTTALCIAAIMWVATAEHGLAYGGRLTFAFASYGLIVATLLDRYRVIWERSLAAAQQSEERLRLALDAGAMGTWDWDLRGERIIWGGDHARIMGLDEADFDGTLTSFTRAIHPDDLQGVLAATEEARRSASIYTREYRVIWPDGSVRWAAGRGRFIHGAGGEPERMLGVVADITPQVQARAELEAALSERDGLLQRLQLVLERAPIGVVMSAPDFTVSYWNPAAERIFGWSAGEILGALPDEKIFIPSVREQAAQLREEICASPQGLVVEALNLRKDGSQIACEWSSTPLLDAQGHFVGLLSMVQDVTERRRGEEELRQLNIELERRVAERTAELAAKNRELEVFAYSVSHDLKAPLRGIDGYSRLLEEDFAGRLDGDGPYYITMIRTAAAGMGQLIDDLLAYSRVERRALRLSGVDLTRLVGLVVAAQGDALAGIGATVSVGVPELTVLAEEEGLAQIVRNLLENAVKFSREADAPAIVIGGEARGDHCLLWVRDNGIGFPMEYHDRMFELFQRLHRAEDYPGTGIGLAIVRKAVERLGGAVWAEGAPGQGATFFLKLPLAEPEAP